MKAGFIEYKCRRCGAVEHGVHTPDIETTMVELLVLGKATSFPGIPCTTFTIHNCGDGVGWADVIGAVPDAKEEG